MNARATGLVLGYALVGCTLLTPPEAAGQSAGEIVERMLAEYERRAEGVQDYTVVQETMGLETRMYFVREERDGRPVFRLQNTGIAGMAGDAQPAQGVDDIYLLGDELTRLAEYRGVERIDDYDLHVLAIDDLSEVDFGRNVTDDSEFVPVSGAIYVDVDTYVPRRMVFEGEMTTERGVFPVTSTVALGDYREVGGMLFPFRRAVTIDGLGAAIDPEQRAQFEKMQRELEEMPEAQRRMVESMMAGRMEEFRALMEGGDASMNLQVLVLDVLVNTGPPGSPTP